MASSQTGSANNLNGEQKNAQLNTQAINNSTVVTTVVNGNGQLGANAMFNLAKIASSEQKQVLPNNSSPVVVQSVGQAQNVHQSTANATAQVVTRLPAQIASVPSAQVRSAIPPQQQPNSAAVRVTHPQPILIPRGANTISLPPGVSLPPGTILMQNDKGQIVFMSRAPAPQPNHSNVGTIPIQPNLNTSGAQVVVRPAVSNLMGAQIRPQPQNVQRHIMPAQPNSERNRDKIKKCKNFLETLIRLSSQQPQQILDNVKKLIRGLLDGTVLPDAFTTRLQKELNSQKQPGLSAFLKESLPELRQSISRNELTIDGLDPQPTVSTSHSGHNVVQVPMPSIVRPGVKVAGGPVTLQKHGQGQLMPGQIIRPLSGAVTANSGNMQAIRNQNKAVLPNTGMPVAKGKQHLDLKDDDDINDVATMGGVNLSEETKNILAAVPESSGQLRSCRDDVFLSHTSLAQKIRQLACKKGLKDVNNDVISLVSHACEERLRQLTEKIVLIAEHRLDIYRVNNQFEPSHDVRSQIKFLEELDKLERKKHEDSEREVLLRAAKSRSKTEDPEQAKLKIKAKELKEQELEEQRQIEANRTALAAIGPRKKRKLDDAIPAYPTTSSSPGLFAGASAGNQTFKRPRLKRVNLRDLTFVLEEDKDYMKSSILFKSYIK